MPLTTVEKSKRYRERLKNNQEKYKISKEKSRARSAKQYQKKMKEIDESKKNEMRLLWRQKYASKKLQSLPSSTGPISNESLSEMKNFDAEVQPRSAVDQVQDIDAERPTATGRNKSMNYSESTGSKNKTEKLIQRNVVNILRRENSQLNAKIVNLERGFNYLSREMRHLKKKYKELMKNLEKTCVKNKKKRKIPLSLSQPKRILL